jgi:hypothetical protein
MTPSAQKTRILRILAEGEKFFLAHSPRVIFGLVELAALDLSLGATREKNSKVE